MMKRGDNLIKIFSSKKQELTSDIDTWIVEWTTYKGYLGAEFPKVKKCYQAFTDKNEALEMKNRINEALNMLAITSLPEAKAYKQERNNLG